MYPICLSFVAIYILLDKREQSYDEPLIFFVNKFKHVINVQMQQQPKVVDLEGIADIKISKHTIQYAITHSNLCPNKH